MPDPRKYALRSLIICEQDAKFTNLELGSVIARTPFTPQEKALYTALLYGITERKLTLDYQIYKLYDKPTDKMSIDVKNLLRLGLYQMIYMNSIPDHAAVSSTMNIAENTVNRGAFGLINALLRKAQRTLKDEDGIYHIITPDRTRDICGYLSITYSVPRFLCKMWKKAYGEEKTEKILKAFDHPAPTVLRVNTLRTTRNSLLDELEALKISASPSELTDDGIILPNNCAVSELKMLSDGRCFVQDDASRLCVKTLDPQEGETVFDLCACPGGKSFAAAIAMKNSGTIRSFDVHESKLSLIDDSAKRLGINIIIAQCADSSVLNKELFEKADRVLCDVPCSGFGTIAKKPDLRNKSAESVRDLPSLQLKILENGSQYVKKNGILVYSTCTLCPAENEDNVNAFLTLHPEFELLSQKTLFPDEGTDGFFFAKLIRK